MARRRPSPAVVGGALGAVAAWWYLTSPGRSVGTAIADIQGALLGSITLTPAQQEMASIVASEFARAGLAWCTYAALANAWAESRLDPDAIGDNGHAVGLFQLNDAAPSAAGYGIPLETRLDPVMNTRRIIEVVKASGLLGYRGRTTHADLASRFGELVERCALCYEGGSEYLARARHVRELFGAQIADAVAS